MVGSPATARKTSSASSVCWANARGLKAALGHVLVSPSQTTGNMTVLMLTVDGGTLSYNVSGAGPPIVFVAGLGDPGTNWPAQVAAFSPAFPLFSFPPRAAGRSHRHPTNQTSTN